MSTQMTTTMNDNKVTCEWCNQKVDALYWSHDFANGVCMKCIQTISATYTGTSSGSGGNICGGGGGGGSAGVVFPHTPPSLNQKEIDEILKKINEISKNSPPDNDLEDQNIKKFFQGGNKKFTVTHDSKQIRLTVEVPGVHEDALGVHYNRGHVVVYGQRYDSQERFYVEHLIPIHDYDNRTLKASLEHGILTISAEAFVEKQRRRQVHVNVQQQEKSSK